MRIFDSIKNKNIDEIAEWIDKYASFDDAPWWKHWDENYCSKCEPVEEYAYCERCGNCKFFKDMKEIPDSKQIIKMWLESESN